MSSHQLRRVDAPFAGRVGLGRPLISAHRGAATAGQDADLAAYEAAIDLGAELVEFDVRCTKDGVLIACHWESIAGRRIAEHDFTDLRSANGSHPPRIEDIMRVAHGRAKLHVDLKERGTEEAVIRLLRRHSAFEDCVITTLEDDVVAGIKRQHPDLCVGLSLGREKPQRLLSTRMSELLPFKRRFPASGADFLAVHFRLAWNGVLRQATRRQVPVMVWTINDQARLERALRDPRIAVVVTDVPDAALRVGRRLVG